jgi:hypothetical protein
MYSTTKLTTALIKPMRSMAFYTRVPSLWHKIQTTPTMPTIDLEEIKNQSLSLFEVRNI